MSFPLQMVAAQSDKECGACSACCSTLKFNVEILGESYQKKLWEPCKHLDTSGLEGKYCTVRENAPTGCRNFRCLWLSGHLDGDVRRRPDHIGVMFYADKTDFGQAIIGFEMHPGALERTDTSYLIERIARKELVLVFRHQTDRLAFFIPPSRREAVMAKIEASGMLSV